MPNRCQFRKQDGKPCGANAQSGKKFCVFHDPSKAEDGRRARREGGINRTRTAVVLPPQTPTVPLRNQLEIATFLAETINQVRRGELDARTANTLGFLANTLSRVLDQGETEDRLARIEARLGLPNDTETNNSQGGLVIYDNPKSTGSN
jgi:hypothetical protein